METPRKNVYRLVGLLLFVAVLGIQSQKEPEPEPEILYLVTVPKILVAGSTELVLVKLHEPYKPVDVWVTLTLDDDVIAEESFVVTDEKKYPLEIPILEACSTKEAQLTVHLKYQSAAAWVVNEERRLRIDCVNSDTFVQTDKPIYKPGQTVHFRILTLDQNFIPITKPVESIWIEAPNQVRVMQWNDQTRETNGLIDLSFPITSDPLLGTWTIHVLFEGRKTKQKFDVEEYVLPRFDVRLSSPSHVLITDEVLSVEVCAVYTYGKPVRGSILLQAKVKRRYRYYFGSTISPDDDDDDGAIPFTVEDTDNDGCGTIDVDLTALNIIFRQLVNDNDEIVLSATFTELASGISQDADTSVTITSRQRDMEWLSERFYRPGLPYNGKIKVTYPDGSPSAGTFSEMTCRQGSKDAYSQNFTTDGDGYITFSLDTDPDVLTSLSCTPSFPDFPSRYTYNRTYNTLQPFHRSVYAQALYSASKNYMQFEPVGVALSVGERASLTLQYTWDANDDPEESRFQFQVIAKGNYLDANIQANSESVRVEPGDGVHYSERRVELDITTEMAPEVRVIAFYIREDTEVITASVALRVLPAFLNKVKIAFSTSEVEPGDYTTLNVEADPGSLCAVGVVDESVILLGGDNQLTSEKVFSSTDKYQLSSAGGYLGGGRSCIEVPIEEEIAYPIEELELEEPGEPEEPVELEEPGEPEEPVELEEPGETEEPVELEEPGETEEPVELEEPGETEEPVELEEPGETEEPELVAGRRKRQVVDYFFPFGGGGGYPEYEDASKAFLDSGVIYISNLLIETSPCSPPFFFRDAPVAFGVAAPDQVQVAQAESAAFDQDDAANSGEEGIPTRVRTYFPETWLWDLYPIGTSGKASVIVNAPDTITDWVGSGFCLNGESGVGISDQVMIRAFRPFFIDLNLPYSVIRGEEIPVKMTIFNYLPKCIVVRVEITRSTQFDLLDAESRVVCVCNAVGVQFYIQPLELGFVPIEVKAVSQEDLFGLCGDSDMSGDVGTEDAIRRDLLVEAEGVEKEQTHNAFFCPQDYGSSLFLDNAALLLPDNYVPDSARGKITLTGDVLGPTLSNLEKLLRIPTGCGEQNMLGLVPNIYVLLYFTSTGQAVPEVAGKAEDNILIGYQKQLKYRLQDGSYSAFGQSDGEGSAWLTAFVVRSFAQARDFVTIDDNDLAVSVQWLKSLQNVDTGCFRNSGRVIHKGMQGGVNDELTLTAYILLAICETGVNLQDEAIVLGLSCLETQFDDISDNYAISLITYALVKLRSLNVREVFEKLKESAISDGGLVHWESNRPDIPPNKYYYRYNTPSIDVEITAYALLSYLAYYELSDAIAKSSPVVRWLVQQQNPHGGFSSTQDTVVALQALAEYSALIFGGTTNIKVTVILSPPCEIFELSITHENRLVLQEQEIEVFPSFVQIAATGEGCALVKVSWKYNVFPEVRNDAPFILNHTVTALENEVSKYNIEICARYTGDDEKSNMALVENKPQSGFAPIQDSFNNIVKGNVKRVDVEERTVVVYFEELTKNGDCVSYDVEKVLDVRQAKEGVLTVFDYYEKELVTNSLYYLQAPDEESYKNRCPVCSEDVPDNFEEIFCKSNLIYKTLVGQNGNINLYGDERTGADRPYDIPFYVSLEFPEGCVCEDSEGNSLVKPDTPLLVMDDGEDLTRDENKPNLGYLPLGKDSAVILWSFPSRRATRMARLACPLS